MKTKWWILLFLALALACGLCAFLLMGSGGGARVGVYLDGELVREINLARAEDESFILRSHYGENTVCIEGGKVYITHADCPDGTCLRHAPLPEAGTPIVCLPHRLVIRVLSGNDSGIDAVAGVAG